MTKMRRIGSIITGLIMIAAGFMMAADARNVYQLLIAILGISLLISGIRSLVYYVSMARHMVGGRVALYRAVIILDMGMFTLTLTDLPLFCVVLYLAGLHGFSGVIDILRSLESRRLQAASWRLKFGSGVVNLVIAGICLYFTGDVKVAVIVYAIGLMYSGLYYIIRAFRKSAIAYDDSPAV